MADTGVHETWELLSNGIEYISYILAPTKIFQHKSNVQPYINDEIRDLGEEANLKFNHAITKKSPYDWNYHNKSKSLYQKILTLASNK